MTATALALPDICDDCAKPRNHGLCSNEHCRRAVLPQRAKPSLVRLQGDARVEQKGRQLKIERSLPVSPEAKAHKARVKSARSIAQQKRRGYFGFAKARLLKAIQHAR